MSSELLTKVESILKSSELPERHTSFQIEKFIIAKEPTIQGQLWQIVREVRARYESLEAMELQLKDMEDDAAIIDIRIVRLHGKTFSDELQNKEKEIRIRKLERSRTSLSASREKLMLKMRYVMEELRIFVHAFDHLSKTEKMKPLDDVQSQRQYWNEKFAEELNLRLLLNGRLDAELVRSVMVFDDAMPVKKQLAATLESAQRMQIERRDRLLAEKKENA
jgi:hypothetical protein